MGMLVARPFIGQIIDRFGARRIVQVNLLLCLLASIPWLFTTQNTSFFLLSALLFIRGISVGGINLPLSTDAFMELSEQEIPQASVGFNIIENIGSSFGTALIASIVATFLNAQKELFAYHTGFLVSIVALVLLFVPSFFLTNKTTRTQRE